MTQRRRRFSSNAFELGIFSFNAQNGMSRLKEVLWPSTWEQNLWIAQEAEEAGLEFLLPFLQWRGLRGYPAESPDEGGAFETLTWASGLLATTSRIAIFGTVHVAYINPVFAAKQCVTAHHIGRGRFGLNVVSGNHSPELFGIPLQDHDAAYDYIEEWVTIVKRIWKDDAPFDYSGRFFNLKGVLSKPKPYGGQAPTLISAGHSHRGRAFAMEHADALFTAITEMDNAREEISTARAASPDGEVVPVYGSSHLVCRPTRKEADEYYHHLVHELGDWSEMDDVLARWLRDRTLPVKDVERLKERLITGVGTFLAQGSYDDVAQQYRQLHEAGLDGVAVAMIDYADQFERLRDEVLPRLERMGLRLPAAAVP